MDAERGGKVGFLFHMYIYTFLFFFLLVWPRLALAESHALFQIFRVDSECFRSAGALDSGKQTLSTHTHTTSVLHARRTAATLTCV